VCASQPTNHRANLSGHVRATARQIPASGCRRWTYRGTFWHDRASPPTASSPRLSGMSGQNPNPLLYSIIHLSLIPLTPLRVGVEIYPDIPDKVQRPREKQGFPVSDFWAVVRTEAGQHGQPNGWSVGWDTHPGHGGTILGWESCTYHVPDSPARSPGWSVGRGTPCHRFIRRLGFWSVGSYRGPTGTAPGGWSVGTHAPPGRWLAVLPAPPVWPSGQSALVGRSGHTRVPGPPTDRPSPPCGLPSESPE
jgi:hypothetical protein